MNQHSHRTALTAIAAILFGFGLGGAASTQEPDVTQHPGEALAERYGLSEWEKVEQIDFVFRVELPDDREIERPWSWRPIDRTVTANAGGDDAVTFSLDEITDDVKDHHAKFINDTYWLVFPFQLVWSTCEVTDEGDAAMPISGEPARKLTVTYPDEGGYTPGDVYELFLDPETGLIAEWNFRRGGGEQGRPATWEKTRDLNGLQISTLHHGPEGSGFTLSFPRVAVQFSGGGSLGIKNSE